MIRELKKYKINNEICTNYVNEYLDLDNILSNTLLKSINFETGEFYTMLPKEEVNTEYISRLEHGGVLPLGNEIRYSENGKQHFATEKNTTRAELSNLLFTMYVDNPETSFIFEDVLQLPNDPHLDFYESNGLTYEERQIYYLLDKNNTNLQSLKKAIHETDVTWHFLCAVFKGSLVDKKNLTKSSVLEISNNTQMIIFGAYDGEGYLFWEKRYIQ